MYISGGSNIYPREIEEKVLTHESISEVAIVGVPDPKWGEVGVAVCVLREGAQLDEAAMLEWMATSRGALQAAKAGVLLGRVAEVRLRQSAEDAGEG